LTDTLSHPSVPRTSPLHDRHVAAGARLVPFAGWSLPIEYAGIVAEHRAVREHAGVFDVSHMGQVETHGPDAEPFLQHMLSNDVAALPVGGAQYAVLCNEDGGVRDDLFTYRLAEDRYLTVTNAANHADDVAWLRRHATGFDVVVEDVASAYAMLAVQGPQACAVVSALSDGPLPTRATAGRRTVAGVACLVCGTGYTGEAGVELLMAPEEAPAVWDALLAAGTRPIGLGARDTLRLEVCFHLYGNDLSAERDPIAAGLGWCCKERTGFVGAEAVAAVRGAGPVERLVAFIMDGPGIARAGNPALGGGVVTSGTLSPSLGVGIGMAYVPADRATPGTSLVIDVRGRHREATVVSKPIYHRPTEAS
jgi:aminomethyltransferase